MIYNEEKLQFTQFGWAS